MKTQRDSNRINNFTRVRGRTNHGCIGVMRGKWAESNPVFSRCPECGRIRFFWLCQNLDCEKSGELYVRNA